MQHQFRASAAHREIHDRMLSTTGNMIPPSMIDLEKSVKQIVIVGSIAIVS